MNAVAELLVVSLGERRLMTGLAHSLQLQCEVAYMNAAFSCFTLDFGISEAIFCTFRIAISAHLSGEHALFERRKPDLLSLLLCSILK